VEAYSPGRASPAGPPSAKLSSNESPLGPAPAVRDALVGAVSSVQRYPDQAQALQALAGHLGVAPTQLLLTNGSDELCYLIAAAFLGPGTVAVVGDPCYQIDATASLLSGATVHRVPLRDGAHDLEAMAKAAQDAAVVWLPTPHNPTGVAAEPSEVETLVEQVPADCLVVVDEAYRAFCDEGLRPMAPELVAAHPNMVFQRTLSKDWGLAGVRIGYGLGAPRVIDVLGRARPPFSVNSLALAAVGAAGASRPWRDMTVARVIEQRSLLEAELDRLGIEHFPSQANFVTARIDPDLVAAALAPSGLVVRDGRDLGLPGWVRISVGWAPAMAQLRAALARLASRSDTVDHQVPGTAPVQSTEERS
jgi:histidinol-phosphate aminotransferase